MSEETYVCWQCGQRRSILTAVVGDSIRGNICSICWDKKMATKRCDKCGYYYLNFHECDAVIDLTKGNNAKCVSCGESYRLEDGHCCDVNSKKQAIEHDAVNHPKHYCSHPSGVECINVVEHMNFCRGNAIKYVWRAGGKGETIEKEIEDLEKAGWYIQREVDRLKKSCARQEAKP